MPPLGNPSAISHSTSSARSDLKAFTSPMASYNFRMRAICDESDMRTFLRLMLMAHSGATLSVSDLDLPKRLSRWWFREAPFHWWKDRHGSTGGDDHPAGCGRYRESLCRQPPPPDSLGDGQSSGCGAGRALACPAAPPGSPQSCLDRRGAQLRRFMSSDHGRDRRNRAHGVWRISRVSG